MPYVDHARRELRLKVVYYGPGLGGKTTNLEHIHRRTRPELRGKLLALNTEAERTLFFDLLPMEIGQYKGYTVRVHLCTVPGQIVHDRIRQLVLRNVDGVVMVVDSQDGRIDDNLESIHNLETNLRLQGDDPTTMPMVVQYNKQDLPLAVPMQALRVQLGLPADVPQFRAVAVRGEGVFETFKAIVKGCLQLLADPVSVPAGRIPSIVPGKRISMFPEAEPSASVPRLPGTPPVPQVDED